MGIQIKENNIKDLDIKLSYDSGEIKDNNMKIHPDVINFLKKVPYKNGCPYCQGTSFILYNYKSLIPIIPIKKGVTRQDLIYADKYLWYINMVCQTCGNTGMFHMNVLAKFLDLSDTNLIDKNNKSNA